MTRRETIFDLSTLEPGKIAVAIEEVRQCNLQRYEFEMLHGLLHFDHASALAVGFLDIRADAFWARGHIPGRPVFPGVLQVESAAQTCSFIYHRCFEGVDPDAFFGFAALEEVRFLGGVVPGDRFVIVSRARRMKKRLAIFDTQGFVGERLVFEGVIKGAQI